MDTLIEQIRLVERAIDAGNAANARRGEQRARLILALVEREGRVQVAAKLLGISRQTVQKAVQKARALNDDE